MKTPTQAALVRQRRAPSTVDNNSLRLAVTHTTIKMRVLPAQLAALKVATMVVRMLAMVLVAKEEWDQECLLLPLSTNMATLCTAKAWAVRHPTMVKAECLLNSQMASVDHPLTNTSSLQCTADTRLLTRIHTGWLLGTINNNTLACHLPSNSLNRMEGQEASQVTEVNSHQCSNLPMVLAPLLVSHRIKSQVGPVVPLLTVLLDQDSMRMVIRASSLMVAQLLSRIKIEVRTFRLLQEA